MDKSKLDGFRAKLNKEKTRLADELKRIHDENQNTTFAEPEYGGDANYQDHMGDAASNVFDRERDLSLEQNLEDLVAQVNEALRRLDAGRYGKCAKCGKTIDEARLRAIPYTDLCIVCKKEEESRR